MRSDDRRLSRLAEAVADGLGVDWADAASSAGNSDEREVIRYLRVLADLFELHRSDSSAPAQPAGPAPDEPRTPAQEPSATLPLPGTGPPGPAHESWGALRIIEEVGSGRFGTVYRALDARL